MLPTSTLKCGSGSAYTQVAKGKNGRDIWHGSAHFKKFRIITKGKQKGWFQIWVVNGLRWFRGKWRPQYRKLTVPPDCIKFLPRERKRRTVQ